MLYQLCDLSGAAAMLKVSRRVGTRHSTHTHTPASSGEVRRLIPSSDSAACATSPPYRSLLHIHYLHTHIQSIRSNTLRLGRRQHPARDLHLPPLPPCRHGRALHRAAEGGVVRGGVPSLRPNSVQRALGGGGHPVYPGAAGALSLLPIIKRKHTSHRGWVRQDVGARITACVGGRAGGDVYVVLSLRPRCALAMWLTHTDLYTVHTYCIWQARNLFNRLELFCIISWSCYPVKPLVTL